MIKKFLFALLILTNISPFLSAMQEASPVAPSIFQTMANALSWKDIGITAGVVVGSAYFYAFVNYVTSVRKLKQINATYTQLKVNEKIKRLNDLFNNTNLDKIMQDLFVKRSNQYMISRLTSHERAEEIVAVETALDELKVCVNKLEALISTSMKSAYHNLLHQACKEMPPVKNMRYMSTLHMPIIDSALWYYPIERYQEELGIYVKKPTNFFSNYILFQHFTQECNQQYLDMISSYHALQAYAHILSPTTSEETMKKIAANYSRVKSAEQSTSGS
jgi:hypothetical protein